MSGSYSGGGPSTGGGLPLPSSLPLLVIRNRVLFPGGLLRLSVGKTRSVRLIEDFLVSQKRSSQQHQHHSSPLPFHRGGLIAVAALLPEASESRGDGSGGGGGGGGGGRGEAGEISSSNRSRVLGLRPLTTPLCMRLDVPPKWCRWHVRRVRPTRLRSRFRSSSKAWRESALMYYLRQQLKTIKEQLGEEEDGSEEDDMTELGNRLKSKPLPRDIRLAAEKELRRLKRMQPSQPEHSVVRSYLEWILDLPWVMKEEEEEDATAGGRASNGSSQRLKAATVDVAAVEAQLDRDHYGLGKVKRRILEYIAVRALTRSLKGTTLIPSFPPSVYSPLP
ncbi:atp-dependent protease la, partial [Nannochloropsis oceanica]